jgi:DNA-binding transcriptional ArsR family regulator
MPLNGSDAAGCALDAVCLALAHPGRRAIVRLLAQSGPCSAGRIAAHFPGVTRSAVSQHLRHLERAGLLRCLPLVRRSPLPPGALPEVRALQALAQCAVDGRVRRYAVEPQLLGDLAGWLAGCGPAVLYSGD